MKISGGSDFYRDGKQKLGDGVNGTTQIGEEFLLKWIKTNKLNIIKINTVSWQRIDKMV